MSHLPLGFFIFITPPLRQPFRSSFDKQTGTFPLDRCSVFLIAWRTCQSNTALHSIFLSCFTTPWPTKQEVAGANCHRMDSDFASVWSWESCRDTQLTSFGRLGDSELFLDGEEEPLVLLAVQCSGGIIEVFLKHSWAVSYFLEFVWHECSYFLACFKIDADFVGD